MDDNPFTDTQGPARRCHPRHGKLHRLDGPAVISGTGTEYWYCDGRLHRVDGPAYSDKTGVKIWFHHGQRHRIDGPAVIKPGQFDSWYLNNHLYTFSKWLENNTYITEEEKLLLKLQNG